MFKKNNSKISYIFLISLLFSISFSAHSYRQMECHGNGFREKVKWKLPRSNGVMDIKFTSHLTGKHTGSLYQATSAINKGPAAVKTIVHTLHNKPNQYAGIFRKGALTGNGKNDIYFHNVTYRTEARTNKRIVDTKTIATTFTRFSCKKGNARIKEADIGLNIYAEILATAPVLYGHIDETLKDFARGGISWPSTIGHEMGHALGLAHTENTYSVMGVGRHHFIHNGSKPYFYFGEDGTSGLVKLYGRKHKKVEDIGITTFKFRNKSNSGEPAPNKFYARSGPIRAESSVPFRSPDGLEGSILFNNATHVEIAFGLENNGKTKQNKVQVKYYISHDKTITNRDTLLKTTTPGLGRNTVLYPKVKLKLPSWLKNDRTYYIGAIVDANNKVHEFENKNNKAVIPIQRSSYLSAKF